MIEAYCAICGQLVWVKNPGTKVFCDGCAMDDALMEWYRKQPPVVGAREAYWRAQNEKTA